jgi:hypothetical protein
MYTQQGKPDTHDTYASRASHVCYTYAFCGQSPYVATFHANPLELDECIAPEKKCSRLQLLAWLSGL